MFLREIFDNNELTIYKINCNRSANEKYHTIKRGVFQMLVTYVIEEKNDFNPLLHTLYKITAKTHARQDKRI